MRFARFTSNGGASFAVVEEDQIIEITGSPFGDWERSDARPLGDVTLTAPCMPGKILAMAENFRSHTHGAPDHTAPQPFWKTPNAVVGPDEVIILPKDAGRVDAEGELVAVIGRRCSGVGPEQALDFVLGYTCGNDVSARDWQREDRQWWRAKSADTFAPIGPTIVTDLDPSKIDVVTRVNGEEVQRCSVAEMIFDFAAVISFISQCVTLEPGDLIFSGTSGTPATLKSGDVVEVEATGIGVLSNPVAEK